MLPSRNWKTNPLQPCITSEGNGIPLHKSHQQFITIIWQQESVHQQWRDANIVTKTRVSDLAVRTAKITLSSLLQAKLWWRLCSTSWWTPSPQTYYLNPSVDSDQVKSTVDMIFMPAAEEMLLTAHISIYYLRGPFQYIWHCTSCILWNELL